MKYKYLERLKSLDSGPINTPQNPLPKPTKAPHSGSVEGKHASESTAKTDKSLDGVDIGENIRPESADRTDKSPCIPIAPQFIECWPAWIVETACERPHRLGEWITKLDELPLGTRNWVWGKLPPSVQARLQRLGETPPIGDSTAHALALFLALSLEDGDADARENMRLVGQALTVEDKRFVWELLPPQVQEQLRAVAKEGSNEPN